MRNDITQIDSTQFALLTPPFRHDGDVEVPEAQRRIVAAWLLAHRGGAISAPMGIGKSALCRMFPTLAVDGDALSYVVTAQPPSGEVTTWIHQNPAVLEALKHLWQFEAQRRCIVTNLDTWWMFSTNILAPGYELTLTPTPDVYVRHVRALRYRAESFESWSDDELRDCARAYAEHAEYLELMQEGEFLFDALLRIATADGY